MLVDKVRSGEYPSLLLAGRGFGACAHKSRAGSFLCTRLMSPREFRDELLRLSEAQDSEGVIRFYENHLGCVSQPFTPHESEDIYGLALPLALFRLLRQEMGL
jgi:hypothetical protein